MCHVCVCVSLFSIGGGGGGGVDDPALSVDCALCSGLCGSARVPGVGTRGQGRHPELGQMCVVSTPLLSVTPYLALEVFLLMIYHSISSSLIFRNSSRQP